MPAGFLVAVQKTSTQLRRKTPNETETEAEVALYTLSILPITAMISNTELDIDIFAAKILLLFKLDIENIFIIFYAIFNI